MNSVHTLTTNDGYNIKYNLDENNIIRVSVPGVYGCLIDGSLSNELMIWLKNNDWSRKALKNLETYLYRSSQWISCGVINKKNGKIVDLVSGKKIHL